MQSFYSNVAAYRNFSACCLGDGREMVLALFLISPFLLVMRWVGTPQEDGCAVYFARTGEPERGTSEGDAQGIGGVR
jgi:hypothetical protein